MKEGTISVPMRRERYTAFFRDELHVRELEPLGVLDQLTEVVVNCGPFVNQSPVDQLEDKG